MDFHNVLIISSGVMTIRALEVAPVVGGQGEVVASSLLQNGVQSARFCLAGWPDAYLDAGALPTLHDRYGISTVALAARITGWLG